MLTLTSKLKAPKMTLTALLTKQSEVNRYLTRTEEAKGHGDSLPLGF